MFCLSCRIMSDGVFIERYHEVALWSFLSVAVQRRVEFISSRYLAERLHDVND